MSGRGHFITPYEDRVSARLWDVHWEDGGVGKHGNGPFATRSQADACIRAVGWPGWPTLDLWTMDRSRLERILRKLKTGLPRRASTFGGTSPPDHAGKTTGAR